MFQLEFNKMTPQFLIKIIQMPENAINRKCNIPPSKIEHTMDSLVKDNKEKIKKKEEEKKRKKRK